MEKTFIEMKLFQVRPDKLDQDRGDVRYTDEMRRVHIA